MSSDKRGAGFVIAVGLLGAACTRPNLAYDQDGDGGQTGGDGTATVGDGTVTTGRPGDGTVGGGTVDGGTVDGGSVDGGSEGSTVCASDEECADDEFCNGAEICDPSHPGADGFGCLPPSAPRCPDGADCIEEQQDCVTNCDVGSDADQDGVDAIECGGLDCDDADEFTYPGAPEVCDEVDNDCNPVTIGTTDDDLDGAISHQCCNPAGGSIECGTDCDDSRPSVIAPGSDWAHCEACNQPCDTLMACQAGACVDARRVFVSSSVQAGDMGGLEGADDICKNLADVEGLGGSFRAYIRNGDVTVEERLEHATVPYVRLDGLRIANNWTDLTDGTLQAPLALDEQRELHMDPGQRAWTGLQSGEAMFDGYCSGWMDALGIGAAGDVPAIGPAWQGNDFQNPCSFELRLYCIEQDGGG